jgi:hypothetical protein
MNHRVLRLGAVVALVCLTSARADCHAASRGAAMSIGTARFDARGRLDAIVLVDPLGRRDVMTDSTLVTGIPKCTRWPGGIEHELDDPDTSYKDLMMFQLGECLPGKYVILATARESLQVNINAVVEPTVGPSDGCSIIERVDRVPPGPVSWTLEIRASPPKGECRVRIHPAVFGRQQGLH